MTFGILIGGFTLFFIMEKFLHWHHCHEQEGDCPHTFTYLILIGDGLHNFIDGLVIAASFLVDTSFGFITTILIIGHEIPQELGDFGVLLHGGMEKKKALCYNFLSQLTAVIGGVVGFFIGSSFTQYLLPLAAGGFVYIAASDLIPEISKEKKIKDIIISFLLFFAGIGFMLLLKMLL
ncbi:MAG: ZIP family metal transporter [bacterium]